MATLNDVVSQALAGLNTGGQVPAASSSSTGKVFVGSTPKKGKLSTIGVHANENEPVKGQRGYGALAPGKTEAGGIRGGDSYKTTDQMYAQWNEWSPTQQKAFGSKLVKLGLMDEQTAADYDQVRKAWMSMVDEAANYAAAGKKLTVDDVVNQYAAFTGGKGAAAGSKTAAQFSGVKSSTGKQFDITDPTSAKDAVNKIFQANLGRDAAPGEIDQFTAALNNAERANPTISKTDSTYQDGEEVARTTTNSGGVDRTQVLADQAKARPEYGTYQAATTYANALFGALSSPV